MTTPLNIRVTYVYRDASNYKQHGEVIFSNETHLPAEEIEQQISSFLNDGEFFIARQVHVEERFFDVLDDDDHPWHEFVNVTATDDPTFDPEPEHKRDIAEFLSDLEQAHCAGWDEMKVREDLAHQFTEHKHKLKQKIEVVYNRAMETNMQTIFQVRIRRNGQITLPKELRDRSLIESGTLLTLHDLGDGVIVMSRTQSRTDKIADQLVRKWREAGESLESMLTTLREVRTEHHTAKR